MVDITEISAVVAAIGVLVGVVFTVLELRHLRKQRRTDLVVRLYSAFTSDDFLAALMKTRSLEFKDYRDFIKRDGPSLETPVKLAIFKVANFYDEIGMLLHSELVDADLVAKFVRPGAIVSWNKLKPLIEGFREVFGYKYSTWFEYLYNEMMERDQQLASKTA
jgi:hypothetical protein